MSLSLRTCIKEAHDIREPPQPAVRRLNLRLVVDGGGATESFENALLPHLSFLRSYALAMTRNASEADDLVQETCLKALRSFRQFEPGTNARAWAARILRNAFLSRSRSPSSAWVHLEEGAEPEDLRRSSNRRDPHEALILRGEEESVESLFRSLPERYRAAFRMAFEGYSYREIADRLEIPLGTVMSRIHRARRIAAGLMRPGCGAAATAS